MSADIWLEDADGNQLDFGLDEAPLVRAHYRTGNNEFNLTYNLTPMLAAAGMPPWSEFIGMRANGAGMKWAKVTRELIGDPDKYRAMNPANGWGTYEGAVEVLGALIDACIAHPDAKIGGWL